MLHVGGLPMFRNGPVPFQDWPNFEAWWLAGEFKKGVEEGQEMGMGVFGAVLAWSGLCSREPEQCEDILATATTALLRW